MTTDSRERVLARIRTALGDVPATDEPPLRRGYLPAHVTEDRPTLLAVLAENLAEYRAHVNHATPQQLPEVIGRLLREHDTRSLAVPADLPPGWLSAVGGVRMLTDGPALTAERLDGIDSALTGCALAVAETGTIVLDAGPGQGRRILTLVPDHHICVVRADQVVASLPRALPLLDPTRPQTWISGPSATSDIELDRVEGVHGPRRLDVVLVGEAPR
ncbi:LUD domain-containing protein [Kitasatospora paracochleata]|uniref:L-lactate dehydrogenase complex protein LldG n=1 Tax=Kitasatospora paracochleata TaxID=58354 RepID=A0ABT1IWZ8_9ACTN|nr:lactate utilization protein C [Kitasatospora paracochleata]MCP2309406.1 L-lactate dehydrogenase complex protein LldG [Kitasatospora paracochleata]